MLKAHISNKAFSNLCLSFSLIIKHGIIFGSNLPKSGKVIILQKNCHNCGWCTTCTSMWKSKQLEILPVS